MSLPATWRQFQLFDFLPVRDPHYKSPEPSYSDPKLSAIAAVQAYIVYAADNYVRILAKSSLEHVRAFCAYPPEYRVSFLRPLAHSNIVVSVAESQGLPAIIKVWDLAKILHLDAAVVADDDAMCHKYITTVSVHDGDDAFPISCVSFNDTLTCIALGYASGKVVLVRGDLLRDRGAKSRVVFEGPEPITSVNFHRSEDLVYVSTTARVFTLLTTGRNQGKPLRVLSRGAGSDLGCADLDPRSSKLVVASTDGFTYYSPSGKAQTVAFSIPKRRILRLSRDYVLVVCSMEDAQAKTGSGVSKSVLTKLLILDLHNMHISFSLTIPNSAVAHVFSAAAGSEAYLLSTDGVLYKLFEKPINQQVELVMQRELFPIALNLARQHSLNAETVLRINKAHAELLYKKQDFDAAVQKYIECLSYYAEEKTTAESLLDNLDDFIIDVITKFKEVSNIHNMTKFLAQLYAKKLADSDHLTLLLCCYCKLKMGPQLDAFIADFDVSNDANTSPSRLDLSSLNFSLIINLFRECGYFSQVTLLLYKLGNSQMIVDVQLNDLHDHAACLSYIKTLPVNELLGVLIDYSKKLLDVMPLETTKLLIEVFTGKYKPEPSHSLFDSGHKDENSTPAIESTEPAITQPSAESYVSSYDAIIGYLASTLNLDDGETPAESTDVSEPTYLPPRPSLVYLCFINHSREFVVFLEACLGSFSKYQGSEQEKSKLVSTLFETYCAISSEETDEKDLWVEKAKTLLAENIESIEKTRALLIAQMYGLKINDVYVKKRVPGAEEDAFRFALLKGDYTEALKIVRDLGEKRPSFYLQMLKLAVSTKDIYEKASRKDFQYLIEKVTTHKLVAPLELLEILGSNEYATIGIVKDYMIDYFSSVSREIANNEKLMELYEAESTTDSVKLSELQTKPFMLNADLCSSCELRLEFPIINFMCKHSYHQSCLSENTYIPEADNSSDEPRCPLCANEILSQEVIRENQLQLKNDYDTFKTRLDESDDPFKVISEYIGRGCMENQMCYGS